MILKKKKRLIQICLLCMEKITDFERFQSISLTTKTLSENCEFGLHDGSGSIE